MIRLFGICLIVLTICGGNVYSDPIDDEIVELNCGKLRGEHRKNYIAFEGIPYAEPPTGLHRFQPPRPCTTQWEGIRNAKNPGESCMQWDHFIWTKDRLRGSEDCLFLNVYTSNVNPVEKYPVVVHIHGGAFMYGNGDFYGPDFLLTRHIVMVNINYRLGPLGFLSTEDDVVPGNMGLKDQNMAIRWVKENIARFGGDPERITITGYSAGGASVHLHYMSPLSAGLFNNGISHSGCALNPWVMAENPLEKAKILAGYVGCTMTNTTELVACLKDKPAEDIVRAVGHFQPFQYNPFSPFGAVVEPKSDTAFLSDSPISIIERGETLNTPWLVSGTEAEGIYPAGEFMVDIKYVEQLHKMWNELAPYVLDYNWTMSSDDQNALSERVRLHYLQSRAIDVDSLTDLIKMISDRMFLVGLQRAVRLQSERGKTVYYYYFRFHSAYGLENVMSQRDDIDLGVSHGDDVYLMYSTAVRLPKHQLNDDELVLQRKFLDLYEQFLSYNG